jgi:SAM-dependent methyltransferase
VSDSASNEKIDRSFSAVAPDPIFADPRLAAIYDALDPDRKDLDFYVDLIDEFGARTVLDIGCGTGAFACLLSECGVDVIGVDPAGASLEVARRKAGADRVRWIHDDATHLPMVMADVATMTGNVAQVFLTDDELGAALRSIGSAIQPEGRVIFEVRDPQREAWLSWNRESSRHRAEIAGVGVVESWVDLVNVALPLVSFRWTYQFENPGDVITSDSTLRFRSRHEVERCIADSGLVVDEVRDAPDRPGLEFVFICRREASGRSSTTPGDYSAMPTGLSSMI